MPATRGHIDRMLLLQCNSGTKCSIPITKDLFIQQLVASDAGFYTCTATNTFGQASSTGYLQVVSTNFLATVDKYEKTVVCTVLYNVLYM